MNESSDMRIQLSDSEEMKNEKKTSRKPKKNNKEYVVEEILEKKKENGEWLYLVKWEDYGFDECTWEPKKNLEGLGEMLETFEADWEETMKYRNMSHSIIHSDKKKKKKKIVQKVSKNQDSATTLNKDCLPNNSNLDNDKPLKKKQPNHQRDFPSSYLPVEKNLGQDLQRLNFTQISSNKGPTPFRSEEIPSKDESRLSTKKKLKTLKKSVKNTHHINIINNISSGDNQSKSLSGSYGSIEVDTPEEIIDFKVELNVTHFLISWKKRAGMKLIPSYVNVYDLEKKHSDLLYDYYKKTFNAYANIRKIASNPLSI